MTTEDLERVYQYVAVRLRADAAAKRKRQSGRVPTSLGRAIVEAVAAEMNIPAKSILDTRRRSALLADARQAAALKMRERGWSYPRIAVELGLKDHTSVWHLVNVRRPAAA